MQRVIIDLVSSAVVTSVYTGQRKVIYWPLELCEGISVWWTALSYEDSVRGAKSNNLCCKQYSSYKRLQRTTQGDLLATGAV